MLLRKRRKRCCVKTVIVITVMLLLWRGGKSWLGHVEKKARVEPEYHKKEIAQILDEKDALEKRDYKLLYEQTGISPETVDVLFEKGRREELLELQKNLFADLQVECTPNTIITKEERTQYRALIPYVEDGDILVTFNCHAYIWRNGHAAIVADAGKGLTVESGQLGTESKIVSLAHWEKYPSFAVLRLKDADPEERAAIGAYAKQELVGITYRLEAVKSGLQRGTHCSHLTWYAYAYFGYDIDADGGWIVTPKDIYDSELLEVVQIYGMPMPDFEEIY